MDTGSRLLMVELNIPQYVHMRIYHTVRKTYSDVVREVTRSRRSGATRVFIVDCPKGWWFAVKLLREHSGRLYVLKEVKYSDIPSSLLELSIKRRWNNKFVKTIEEELKMWGLK